MQFVSRENFKLVLKGFLSKPYWRVFTVAMVFVFLTTAIVFFFPARTDSNVYINLSSNNLFNITIENEDFFVSIKNATSTKELAILKDNEISKLIPAYSYSPESNRINKINKKEANYQKANTNIAYTREIDIIVDALPTLPTIIGDTEIVTNVGTTEYTATADNADNYIWGIAVGTGEIAGTEIGTVYWPEEGYIGMTEITVQGSNSCGVGPIATMDVYIEFLNPKGSNSENDASETTKQAGEFSVNAYPNPNNGNFKVELPEGKTNCMLTIQDNMGLKVLQKNVTNNIVDIDISNLSTGIYHLTLLIDGEIHSMTIIKK